MRGAPVLILISLLTLAWGPGCNRNPFLGPQQQFGWQQPQQPGQPISDQVAQLQDLNRRNTELDSDNNDLHRQLAQSQQQMQLLNDEVGMLRKQLKETATLAREAELAKQQLDDKVQAMQASTRARGGAAITANNSFKKSLDTIELPGVVVRQDNDVIRIELPSDQLFTRNTAQFQAAASPLLKQVADAIRQSYTRQRIVIEGHTDNGAAGGGSMSSKHRLTLAQAAAVFDQFTATYNLPQRQLAVMGHGDNHPLASNATVAGQEKNRRVEVVIYPETID